MEIYVMRHEKTVWNEKRICQGRSQNRLSKFGKSQAENQATKYKDTKFDIIFASPLMRTMQTTNIMNKYHKAKVIRNDRLLEVDEGIFTGKKKGDLTDEQRYLINQNKKSSGVETYEHIYERTIDFLNFLRNNYFEGQVVAIIHRTNDNDDKLVVMPKGKNYTDEQIEALTEFQEQWFEHEILR